jgi:DNA ligase-1
MSRKPSLAEDAILDKVVFPCYVQPKIDGVRAMNLGGTLTGRSLDPHEGFGVTERFSGSKFLGLDGEMTLGDKPNSEDRLCSLTTGAMGRFKGVTEMADIHWWVFDLVTDNTVGSIYAHRYAFAASRVEALNDPRIHLVLMVVCTNREELEAAIARFFAEGYEGTIIRNPQALYKEGRATKKGQELWRVKPWGDAEILVTGVTEGAMNTNEAKKNTLGRTERSSAQDGMVPNGMVGSIQGTMLKDFHCPHTKKLLFAQGLPVTVGPGKMTDIEAAYYFANQGEIVGHPIKFKHMTHGVKDLPRFGTYLSHRSKQDMS